MEESPLRSFREHFREHLSLKILIVACVTGLIVYFLFQYLVQVDELIGVLKRANWWWLAIPISLETINFYFMGHRFNAIAYPLGHRISLIRVVHSRIAVAPLAFIIPGQGHDLLRAVVLRDKIPPLQGSGVVIAERLLEAQTLYVLGVVGCVLTGQWMWFFVLFAAWACIWTLIAYLVKNPEEFFKLPLLNRLRDEGERVLEVFKAYDSTRTSFWRAQLFAAAVLLVHLVDIWILLKIFGAEISFLLVLGLWPLALFAGLFPFTIAGIGARDAAFVFLLSSTSEAGVIEPIILASTFSYIAITRGLPAVIGTPFLLKQLWKM